MTFTQDNIYTHILPKSEPSSMENIYINMYYNTALKKTIWLILKYASQNIVLKIIVFQM